MCKCGVRVGSQALNVQRQWCPGVGPDRLRLNGCAPPPLEARLLAIRGVSSHPDSAARWAPAGLQVGGGDSPIRRGAGVSEQLIALEELKERSAACAAGAALLLWLGGPGIVDRASPRPPGARADPHLRGLRPYRA